MYLCKKVFDELVDTNKGNRNSFQDYNIKFLKIYFYRNKICDNFL